MKSNQPRDNYIYTLYINSEPIEVTINTSVDLIALSNIKSNYNTITNVLKSFCDVVDDHPLKNRCFSRRRLFRSDTNEIELLYGPNQISSYQHNQSMLYIHDPNVGTIRSVDNALRELGAKPKLSKIELVWDLYPQNYSCWFLKAKFEEHLFLRYARTSPGYRETTYYANNLRKSAYGIRLYPRPKESDFCDFVRFELELHRYKISRLGLYWPLSGEQLATITFSNFFSFRTLQHHKLCNNRKRKFRKQIRRANVTKTRANTQFRNAYRGQLIERMIQSHIRMDDDQPLMVRLQRFKQYGINCAPFLRPIDSVNRVFQEAAVAQKFNL